jgi:O-antigen/teichoic acid export membrane protein
VWLWGSSTPTAWFALALAPLFVFHQLGNGLFVGLQQIKTFSLMQPVSSAIVLPLLVVAAMMHAGPGGFLAANVLAWAATIAVMLFLLFRQTGQVGRFRPDVFVSTFSYSTKVYVATLAGFLVLRMNVFVVSAGAGIEQVGYYSVASQVADTLAILPQAVATILFPRLVASRSGRLNATMRDAGRIAAVMLIICSAVWMLAEPAIQLAFGAEFAPAAPVLRAILPAVFLLGVMSVVSQYLAASGFPLAVVGCWLGAVALCGSLSRALVAGSGAVGAGQALSVTYAVLLAALLLLCWRTARTERGDESL